MSSLLSRHAESVFWMARYFERAESLARILETQTSFRRGGESDSSWAWIVALYSDGEAFAKAFPDASASNVIRFYMAHLDNPGSIQSAIRSARENARALRPMLSTDMWYQLNDFYNRILGFGPSDYSEVRLSRTCDAVKRGCYAQVGVAENTLYHDEAWPFFRLGTYIERADQMSRLLDVRFARQQTGAAANEDVPDDAYWAILLRSASAYHSYRRVSPRNLDAGDVARFLIFDPRLPRSIAYSLGEIQNTIAMLQRGFGLDNAAVAAAKAANTIASLDLAQNDDGLLNRLHAFNDLMQLNLMELTQELGLAFFGHAGSAPESTLDAGQPQSSPPSLAVAIP